MEMDGEVVGALYSQRIDNMDRLLQCKLSEVGSLHDDGGKVVQMLGLNVLPERQHLGLGDQLLDLILLRSGLQGGVGQVAGITRCKDFRGRTLEELHDYIQKRTDAGQLADPILQFHYSHGAKILGAVPDYRPEDTDNLGAGVLLSYDLGATSAASVSPQTATDCQVAKAVTDTKSQLESCLRNLLGPSRQAAFSWKHPLREMGLDSLNLLEFRTLLQQTFGRPFSSTFFFSHPTLSEVGRYLDETTSDSSPVETNPPTGGVSLESKSGPALRIEEQTQIAGSHGLIAVIGMAGKFPGCAGLDQFWDMLK
jgi:polyketide synthase PksN